MKVFCNAIILKLGRKLLQQYQKVFPPPKIEQGIAYVEDVEEVPVRENIFYSKQLLLCENVPPQVDYYLVFLVFEKEHYQIKSHQICPKYADVEIEYIRRIGGIRILRILKKAAIFET